jgi:hypothetical protein
MALSPCTLDGLLPIRAARKADCGRKRCRGSLYQSMRIAFDSAAAFLETKDTLLAGTPMTIPSILLPVFVEVALIFVLLGLMAKSRMDAMKGGVSHRDIALSTEAYPATTRQISNCYGNQFEMPMLFISAVIIGIVVRQAGTIFVLVEWLFVIARIGHAFVHTTSNNLTLRGPLFLASAICVALLWLSLALGILFGIR